MCAGASLIVTGDRSHLLPMIRHWTKLGLLHVSQTTPSGYQLFAADAIDRCRRIQSLKGRRQTLAEIRTELGR